MQTFREFINEASGWELRANRKLLAKLSPAELKLRIKLGMADPNDLTPEMRQSIGLPPLSAAKAKQQQSQQEPDPGDDASSRAHLKTEIGEIGRALRNIVSNSSLEDTVMQRLPFAMAEPHMRKTIEIMLASARRKSPAEAVLFDFTSQRSWGVAYFLPMNDMDPTPLPRRSDRSRGRGAAQPTWKNGDFMVLVCASPTEGLCLVVAPTQRKPEQVEVYCGISINSFFRLLPQRLRV